MRTFTSSMSRWVRLLAAGVLVAGVSGSVLAGIAATRHNLSTSGTGPNHVTAGTDQICVFCHTPHGSNTAASVPLWNKGVRTSVLNDGNYKTYNSTVNGGSTSPSSNATSSIDGRILNVGSVSIACLSCHDGTQAMDNMINQPGRGGYAAGGGVPGISPVGSTAYTWLGGGVNQLATTPFPNLQTDLTDDHPIGIEYCGGGITSASLTTCRDADFNMTDLKTSTVNGQQIFWVDKNPATGRQKDDITLYTRDFSTVGGSANTPSVECASCHDPHVESKGTDNVAFMRISTEGSKICLACHIK